MRRLDDEGRQRASEHRGLALRLARARWRRSPWLDREDLEGAALYGLCLASAAWKGECDFGAFAIRGIDLAIGHEIRRWRRGAAEPMPFDGAEYLVESPDAGWSEGPVRDAFERLPATDRFALERVVIQGETVTDASRHIGIRRFAVGKALDRGKRRLREALA